MVFFVHDLCVFDKRTLIQRPLLLNFGTDFGLFYDKCNLENVNVLFCCITHHTSHII